MCGIAGRWSRKPGSDASSSMAAALRSLTHRGPDDCGEITLAFDGSNLEFGHTRLSIIDLSAGGHQPMQRENRYSIIYNGEIYNYKELRAELNGLGQEFTSDSDTEVLLAAWAQWKEDALPRLKGMFAFALHDRCAKTLTLARDAFGIKPLYYAAGDAQFAFASEPRALRHLLPGTPRVDLQRAYDYLVFGSYDDCERTFFDGIRQVLPGNAMTVDVNTGSITSIHRWWLPSVESRGTDTFAQATERIRGMVLDNVRLHLRSDVPLGAALSGGIDSSAIVCGMRYLEPSMPIHTFTYAARGSSLDEEPWADLVNEHVGAISHKVVTAPAELAADLKEMIQAQGEPFGSTSIYAQYRVFRLARESGITVTLEGQGADELFGGYNGYAAPVLRGLLESGRFGDAVSFASAWSKWPGRSLGTALLGLAQGAVPDALRGAARTLVGRSPEPSWLNTRSLREVGVKLAEPPLPSEPGEGRRHLAAALRTELTRRGLPALLRHGDRNSMRWSIESRVPFLTTDMAEYVLGLPDEYLVSRGGETKRVLRAAMRGIVPDRILDRRDKVGFATPEELWLRSIADTVRGWLRDDPGVPFLDQTRALQEFESILAGQKKFSWQVWRWINFTQWYRLFF
jgi:asparagine synthase (glutamine-hydrolysing)